MKRFTLAALSGAAAIPLIACGFLQNLPIPGANQSAPTATKPAAAQAPASTQAAAATKPAAAATQPAVATKPAAAATAAPVAGGESIDLSGIETNLDKLKSFRVSWSMTWDGKDDSGKPQTGSLTILQESIAASKDQHLKMTSKSSDKPAAEALEWFQIGQSLYIYNADKTGAERCFVIAGSDGNTPGMALNPGEFLTSANSGRLVKQGEVVNGVATRQYAIDDRSVTLGAAASVQGNIWLAADGGYPVKYQATAKGASLGLFGSTSGEGTLTMSYDLTDINKVTAITPPADCPKPGAGLPIPPNATEKSSIGPITSFKTADSPKTVADYYRKEMATLGYKLDQDTAMGDLVSLTFSKNGAVLNVMITKDGANSSVMLSEGK